ncbi:MAG: ABC-F family ATP-binding cassette domain-containing protein [Candidatus Moraniibacteriota bacterium]|nr:MAG: ABC-F family ATP-binding cassette domain-containing protein [Candidatus Moranbacteria bacterium]
MAKDSVVLRLDEVSLEYSHNKSVLDSVSFSLRRGAKFTLMGQNGAGKSSLFKIITGEVKPNDGKVSKDKNTTIAIGKQTIPREELELSLSDYFSKYFHGESWDLPRTIASVLDAVNLPLPPLEKKIREFSGGQQARILLASALIQDPDILLLDEPTNNLDAQGIAHLTQFLIEYDKTVLVISHDADFLNSFTEGVLYLDIHTHKLEQYSGNYYDVVEEISRRIEKEQSENVRLERTIKQKKDQANVFANKGGKLRAVAKRMRDLASDLEENKVTVRKEDKTLPPFHIPAPDLIGPIITIRSISVMKPSGQTLYPVNLEIKRNTHVLISGPNGIGKSTFLESLAKKDSRFVDISPEARIGYYRQDFSTLDFHRTAFAALQEVMEEGTEETVYATAAKFLLPGSLLHNKVESLSEGQKGLLLFARLVMQQPNLLILDEPTNHINFRHIPVIAKALHEYKGAMILVSHAWEFVSQIRIDEEIDLSQF